MSSSYIFSFVDIFKLTSPEISETVGEDGGEVTGDAVTIGFSMSSDRVPGGGGGGGGSLTDDFRFIIL